MRTKYSNQGTRDHKLLSFIQGSLLRASKRSNTISHEVTFVFLLCNQKFVKLSLKKRKFEQSNHTAIKKEYFASKIHLHTKLLVQIRNLLFAISKVLFVKPSFVRNLVIFSLQNSTPNLTLSLKKQLAKQFWIRK